MIGTRLSHFEITAKLGEGGMGEVYRAEDTKLGREVAIKVLPEAFTADPERFARFEREARLLASVNHPNIASIYEVGHEGAVRFLVMELVEGENLATRLERGAVPLDEALPIALQITEALEAAHEKGIVHRDLKPANVMVGSGGTIKVLDFGLAKTTIADGTTGAGFSESPTITAHATEAGAILGTAAYMSPEQVRGQPVDKRSDIWALGVIVMEMLTGKRLYPGETASDILAGILARDPDLDTLPVSTPRFLVRSIGRCLEKDPRRRLRDVGELRFVLEEYSTNPDSEILETAPKTAAPSWSAWTAVPWILAVVLSVTLIWALSRSRADGPPPPTHSSSWSIALDPGNRIALPSPGGGFDYSRTVAISPDGSRIAFSVQNAEDQAQIFVKTSAPEPYAIPGTTNGRGPFFSPDSQWIGFYQVGDNHLYKVSLSGGSPQKLCEFRRTVSFDATWSPDGQTIVFATDEGLWRVPAVGGAAEQLTTPDTQHGEGGHHSPRFTLDGRAVLFTVSKTPNVELAILDLDDGRTRTIAPDISLGVHAEENLLVVARQGELLTAPYDPASQRLVGSMVPVLQGIQTTPGLGGMVLTQFDISQAGTLAYVPAVESEPPEQLLWVDMEGAETLITEGAGNWVHPRLSFDGSRISLDIHSPNGMRDVYIFELDRGQFQQLTHSGMTWESEWSPDGDQIAVLSTSSAGRWSLYSVATDFSGPPLLLFQADHAVPGSWLPSGKALLFTDVASGGIWSLGLGERRPNSIMDLAPLEGFPRLSPDGRWMAYVETEAGQRNVFVRSFPELGPRYKVSISGGGEPVWSHDGRRLFFRHSDEMFEVDVRYDPSIHFGAPRSLFRGNYDAAPGTGHQHFDIDLDDSRFLMIRHGQPKGPFEVLVVLNWTGTHSG